MARPFLLPGSVWVLACCCLLASALARAAILPHDYQAGMGAGFTTNWFKSEDPLSRYKKQTLIDIHARGFDHLRLRSRADLHGFATDTFDPVAMDAYLDDLETVLDDMQALGMKATISWIHHDAEEFATDIDGDNFVQWWGAVAERLKDRPHEVSFNLFTEIGAGALRDDKAKYNDWTQRAVNAIRTSGGNNAERILILGAPAKKSASLTDIAPSIYANDDYMMAEWHLYASGPSQNGGQKNWVGTGSEEDRANVTDPVNIALNFTADSGLPTYFGAWMPYDNLDGSLEQYEIEAFAEFFTDTLADAAMPWALNSLDNFYDELDSGWKQTDTVAGVEVDVAAVLDVMGFGAAVPAPATLHLLVPAGALVWSRRRTRLRACENRLSSRSVKMGSTIGFKEALKEMLLLDLWTLWVTAKQLSTSPQEN